MFPAGPVLRMVSWLVPADRRSSWLAEWRAEVEHAWVGGRGRGPAARVALRTRLGVRALSAVVDALGLRRRRRRGGAWGLALRDAGRSLRRRPGFTLAVVGTLALGLGASTAIFSVLDGLWLRPLPFRDPHELVALIGSGNGNSLTPDALREWRSRTDVFQDVRANSIRSLVLTGQGEPRSETAFIVEPGFLRLLGIRPTLGRGLVAGDAVQGNDHVVLLTDVLWRGAFGADPRVLGRSIELDGEPYTVVGVLPPTLRLLPMAVVQLVVPLTASTQRGSFSGRGLLAMGRLRPGLTLSEARARVDGVAKVLDREEPREGGWQVRLVPLDRGLGRDQARGLAALAGAALCLLLIACTNAAGLLILRGVSRRDELTLRIALGSSRRALAGHVLVESVLMALAAASGGALLAWLGVRALVVLLPPNLLLFSYTTVTLDGRVLAFGLGLTVVTGLAFGTLPALRAGTVPAARYGGGATSTKKDVRLRATMQVAQIALVMVLLWGAGVFARSFGRLMSVQPGFDAGHLLSLRLASPPRTGADSGAPEAVAERADAIDRRLRALPGVVGVARSSGDGFSFGDTVRIDGLRTEFLKIFTFADVDTAYFRVMGIPILQGRGFTAADATSSFTTAVVDRSLARRLWPHGSAVGHRFRVPGESWLTVVGVCADAKLDGPREPFGSLRYFLPGSGESEVWVRTAGEPAGLAASVRSVGRSMDPDRPIWSLETGKEMIGDHVRDARLLMDVVAAFALVALLLATVGIYGLVSFTVAQRRREIGIRMALGARAGDLVGGVLRQGILMGGAGVVLGLAGIAALSHLMATLLFGVSPVDPAALAVAGLALLACCAVALLAPARRAAGVNPSEALRSE